MAYPYNTYGGNGANIGSNQYSPYQYQFPSAMPQLQQATNNTGTGSLMTIFVNSEDEVTSYPVAAGLTVLLISFNLKKFWLKTTDTSGVPQQIRSFSFDEKTPSQNQNGSVDGVSRKEFNELSAKLDRLINELGGTK